MLAGPSTEAIKALAPDPGVLKSGEGLAAKRHWSGLGRSETTAWGLCQGSGSSPYQVALDLTGPAFKCSCPSRKFPCKHGVGLGLLLAMDAASFGGKDVPAWVDAWVSGRASRAAAAAVKASEPPPEVDEAARARRIEARTTKVEAGVEELDRWLADLVRRGLANAKNEKYAFWDTAGARLVDAQAASLGRLVRELGSVVNSGPGWADRLLDRIGRLHLIAQGSKRLDGLSAGLQADVRSLVGWSQKEDEIPDDDVVTDRWLVIGRTMSGDDRLTTARTYMLGEESGRHALHLAFGAGGARPATLGFPGHVLPARLAFFPSATPLRIVVRGAAGTPVPMAGPAGGCSIASTARDFSERLSANPIP